MAGKHISLLVHFVWSTAGREPWISSAWEDELYRFIGGVLSKKNAKLLEAGGISDHIHLYTSLPSTISLAEVVNAVKSNSSRWIHNEFRNCRGFAWQDGYGAFSVSKSSERDVRRYIQRQKEHHARQDFKASIWICWIGTASITTNDISGINAAPSALGCD
jgi:REP element-mobilizing transposase RayT